MQIQWGKIRIFRESIRYSKVGKTRAPGRPILFLLVLAEADLGTWHGRKKAGELFEGMLSYDDAVSAKAMF
jgi:hypothetical protein